MAGSALREPEFGRSLQVYNRVVHEHWCPSCRGVAAKRIADHPLIVSHRKQTCLLSRRRRSAIGGAVQNVDSRFKELAAISHLGARTGNARADARGR